MQGAIVLPLAIVAAGLMLSAQMGTAKPEYTRKTKLECEKCHPPNARTLTDAGEYYRTHHYKMDGYKPKEEARPKDADQKDKDKARAKHA